MINWNATLIEQKTIARIVKRAVKMKLCRIADTVDLEMDITACHLNGTPLDLEKLEKADDFNFIHDVGGIRRHIDRNTGKIVRGFLPRCWESGVTK